MLRFISHFISHITQFICAGLLAVLANLAYSAADYTGTDQVKVRLLASAETVRPGDTVVIALQQQIIPHWHTYWQNPGDSGLATTIAWDLPKGARADAIQWPLPSRFSIGPVTNYGYENEVSLLSALHVPQDAIPGSQFPVKAKVNWLVCEEICIPQEATLSLSLPVGTAAAVNLNNQHLINQAATRLPVVSPWPVRFETGPQGLVLRVDSKTLHGNPVKDLWFYAAEWGKVQHNAEQTRRLDGNSVLLQLAAGEAPAAPGEPIRGVLVVTENMADGTITRGFAVGPDPLIAERVPAQVSSTENVLLTTQSSELLTGTGLASALLLALLGGMILNLMPCVFPVLSIKALSLLQHAQQAPRIARLHGLAYTGGVLASFSLLAALLIALKAGGSQIGWGFQFQSPLFVLAMAYLMFAVGLSLSGVFTIGSSISGAGSSLAGRSGYAGSFFTGVLATIVATPCTAPFMGAAIGFALAQSAVVLMAVFLSLGFGLALPYLILSAWPRLQRSLPKPGLWMERVKQALAFPMYGAAVWLVWVLAQQAGIDAVAIALSGMVALAVAAWLYETARNSRLWVRRGSTGAACAILALLLTGSALALRQEDTATQSTQNQAAGIVQVKPGDQAGSDWERFSPERLQTLRDQGKPVFVNFTAAWCISCLVNERVALSHASVREAMQSSGITYLKADWTSQDAQITRTLAGYGRSGVPLYLFYPKGHDSKPVVLPQILTPDLVRSTFNTPGLSSAASADSNAFTSISSNALTTTKE